MFSAYVHIPFCLQKCHYCDFYSLGWGEKRLPETDYVQALSQEMTRWTQCVKRAGAGPWESIFFGGGTPSLFSAEAIGQILGELGEYLPWDATTEITLEMNPKTADPNKLRAYRSLGVNRISLGIQSLEDALLERLGRAHNREDALRTLLWIEDASFPRYSVDLMYGLPYQGLGHVEDTLDALQNYPLKHLSAYELILEEHTPFYHRYRYDQSPLPPTGKVLEMRKTIANFVQRRGMKRYEISNWAAPGFESLHNLRYWDYKSFIGLGASAVSFLRWEELTEEIQREYSGESQPYGVRITNPKDLKTYLKDSSQWEGVSLEWVDHATAHLEWVMMGLRKAGGISKEAFHAQFGVDFPQRSCEAVQEGIRKGWFDTEDSLIYFSPEGVLWSNEAIQLFMD